MDYLVSKILFAVIRRRKKKLSPGREVDGVEKVGVFLFFWQFGK